MALRAHSHKKIKKFFGEKTAGVKRVRTLLSYEESAKEDTQAFYEENHEQIFTLITERFAECESAPKPVRKGKHYMADFLALLNLLRTFVDRCLTKHPEYMNDLEPLLNRALGYSNKHSTRLIAYQTLLNALDLLYDKPHQKLLPLLQEAINVQPFYSEEIAEIPSSFLNGKALSPANTMPSVEESVEMWRLFVRQIPSHPYKFPFWFDLLKRIYLPVYSSKIIRILGIQPLVNVAAAKQFAVCPPVLCHALAEGMSEWLRMADNDFVRKTLGQEENLTLLILLCHDMCLLPIEYADTTYLVIEGLRGFLFEEIEDSTQLRDNIPDLQAKYKEYIQSILCVFNVDSSSNALAMHENLCNKVLAICYQVTQTRIGKKDGSLWKTVQLALLETVTDFLGNANPFSVGRISTAMADSLLRCLFHIWLISPSTTEEMWSDFSQRISALLDWKAVLDQWREFMLQLTMIYKRIFYKPLIEEHRGPTRKKFIPGSPGGGDAEAEPPKRTELCSNLEEIEWSSEKISRDWHIWREILGNLNSITVPENFAAALSCSSSVVDALLEADDQVSLERPRLLPLCEMYLPGLLEACSVEEKRNRGRLVAYSTLCKLFCRLDTPTSLPAVLFLHFYRVLRQGLSSGHSSVIWTIFRHATSIFSLDLPGVKILIPYFVREIGRLFRTDSKSVAPADVQHRALQILCSLICYPHTFPKLTFEEMAAPDEFTVSDMEQLKDRISTLFLLALSSQRVTTAQNRICALFSLTVIVCQDIAHPGPRVGVVRDILSRLLTTCMDSTDGIAEAALQMIASLSAYLTELNALDLVQLIIDHLCTNVRTLLHTSPDRADIIAEHYHTLLGWTLHEKAALDQDTLDHIFQAVQSPFVMGGATLESFDFLLALQEEHEAEDDEVSMKSTRRRFLDRVVHNRPAHSFRLNRRSGTSPTVEANPGRYLAGGGSLRVVDEPVESNAQLRNVQAAARYFFRAFQARYQRYPLPLGTSEGDVVDTESLQDNEIYLIYNLQTVYCLRQLPSEDGKTCTRVEIVLRDCTGRYGWTCNLENCRDERDSLQSVCKRRETQFLDVESPFSPPEQEDRAKPYAREKGVMPQYVEETDHSEVDMAKQMLQYLEEENEAHVPSGVNVLMQQVDKIDRYLSLIDDQSTAQEECLSHLYEQSRPALPLIPEFPIPKSSLHLCRLFLSHMGLVQEAREGRLELLTHNLRLKRSLRELDKTNGREMIKAGLIYVQPGQEHQRDILANNEGSQRYLRFSHGLGWSVDLQSHGAYNGGLDVRSTGKTALYYADALVEMIFHEVIRMPTSTDDLQQIHKKRHVGNDNVHVIYTEHKREYDPATITSQFNDAHVVVHPLANGLYRIITHKKEKLKAFGPLDSGMVVSEQILSRLVRVTAINASNSSRQTSELYQRPLFCRQNLLKEIHQRYRMETPFPEFTKDLFLQPPPE